MEPPVIVDDNIGQRRGLRDNLDLTEWERAWEQQRRVRLFERVIRRRDLISFKEMADWLPHEPERALRILTRAAIRGELGSWLYCMPPHVPTYRPYWIRRSPIGVQQMRESMPEDLPGLYVSRAAAAQWLQTLGIKLPSGLTPNVLEVASVNDVSSPTVATAQRSKTLRPAPERKIRRLIESVYEHAHKNHMKPPNVKEVGGPVLQLLATHGLTATKAQIANLAGEAPGRIPPGKRVNGSLLPFSLEGWKKSGAED